MRVVHSEVVIGRPETMVILVSVWHEDGVVRGRVTHDVRGVQAHLACGSIDDLVDKLRTLLETWDRGDPFGGQ